MLPGFDEVLDMLTLYTIAMILLLFGATIFVHELGHFLVARWCGMVVEVFSIGFGPAIWMPWNNCSRFG